MLHPVRLMENEHARLRERFDHLRQLAEALPPPTAAAARWRETCEGLATLHAEVADHMRFEEAVLYPEALEVERRLE